MKTLFIMALDHFPFTRRKIKINVSLSLYKNFAGNSLKFSQFIMLILLLKSNKNKYYFLIRLFPYKLFFGGMTERILLRSTNNTNFKLSINNSLYKKSVTCLSTLIEEKISRGDTSKKP